jgi:cytochrome c peroxidase
MALIVISVIFSLPFILPKRKFNSYSDEELRNIALSRNMLPVPKTYDKLLKVVNTSENPLSKNKILLGKELFFDPILSKDNTISCANCHILNDGGDDNRPTAIGYKGRKNPYHLNSPTVLNAALAKFQFWDGRAKDVEEQAGGPIQSHFEMNLTPKEAVKKISENIHYKKLFEKVFSNGVTFENIKKSIGAYERTLLTRSGYDRFLEGDNKAMSEEAKKGFALFIDLGCKGCHTGMSVGGQSMQRFPLRRCKSIYDLKCTFGDQRFPFENTGGFLGKDGEQRFRVPILRNVARTSPYFHNGSIKKLEDAVKIMGEHQVGVELDEKQINQIVAFLKSLNGTIINYKSLKENGSER